MWVMVASFLISFMIVNSVKKRARFCGSKIPRTSVTMAFVTWVGSFFRIIQIIWGVVNKEDSLGYASKGDLNKLNWDRPKIVALLF